MEEAAPLAGGATGLVVPVRDVVLGVEGAGLVVMQRWRINGLATEIVSAFKRSHSISKTTYGAQSKKVIIWK